MSTCQTPSGLFNRQRAKPLVVWHGLKGLQAEEGEDDEGGDGERADAVAAEPRGQRGFARRREFALLSQAQRDRLPRSFQIIPQLLRKAEFLARPVERQIIAHTRLAEEDDLLGDLLEGERGIRESRGGGVFKVRVETDGAVVFVGAYREGRLAVPVSGKVREPVSPAAFGRRLPRTKRAEGEGPVGIG